MTNRSENELRMRLNEFHRGVRVRNAGSNWEHVPRGEPFVGATSWNQSSSIKKLRSAPVVFEGISHLYMFGVKDPRSRRALKRQVRYLTNSPQLFRIVIGKCPNKHVHGLVNGLTNAYRRSSCWHTRAWAQAVIRGVESDAVRRHEPILPKMRKWT